MKHTVVLAVTSGPVFSALPEKARLLRAAQYLLDQGLTLVKIGRFTVTVSATAQEMAVLGIREQDLTPGLHRPAELAEPLADLVSCIEIPSPPSLFPRKPRKPRKP